MAQRPSADKESKPAPRSAAKRPAAKTASSTKATPKKPAANKPAAKKSAGQSRSHAAPGNSANGSAQARTRSTGAPTRDGSEVLKEGVARLFGRGRELLSEKGPGLLNSIERATVVAIDQTAKGLTAFEKSANDLEAKMGQGLKDLLDRRRGPKSQDKSGPSGPKP